MADEKKKPLTKRNSRQEPDPMATPPDRRRHCPAMPSSRPRTAHEKK